MDESQYDVKFSWEQDSLQINSTQQGINASPIWLLSPVGGMIAYSAVENSHTCPLDIPSEVGSWFHNIVKSVRTLYSSKNLFSLLY